MFAGWRVVFNLVDFKFSSQIISLGRTIQMLFQETQLKDICNGGNPFIFKNPHFHPQKTLKSTLPMFPGHLGSRSVAAFAYLARDVTVLLNSAMSWRVSGF